MNNKPEIKPKGITPLKRICMTIGELPTSYLETMTYYEMLVWFTKFLQDRMIPALDNNALAVEELQKLFIELQSFVNNYFDNLDVQDEINNKLDQMLEDGVLEQIIEQYIQSSAIWGFNNVADMKQATNLIDGSFARTLGYHSKNDGGGAIYKIRTITNNDVIDEGSIIELNDNTLIGELIIEDKINILNFGYNVESINFDNRTANVKNITNSLKNAIAFNIKRETEKGTSGGLNPLQIYFPDDIYYLDEQINLNNSKLYLYGDSPYMKEVDYKYGNVRQKILTSYDGSLFYNGDLYLDGLNFENILNNGNTNNVVFSDVYIRSIYNCRINNYDIVINHRMGYLATIDKSMFLNCRKYFIKCDQIVDSYITNNYINSAINGTLTTAIQTGNMSMTIFQNNFVDFFTTGIAVTTQCEELKIIDNIFDYLYRGINIAGVTGGIISNNSFNHISKEYYERLNYPSGSDQAINNWIAIVTGYTITSLIVSNNTIEHYDQFTYVPQITNTDSIIFSNNTMNNYTKYGTFVKPATSPNVKFYDLNDKEYLVEPVWNNTYTGQRAIYNGAIYKNIQSKIFIVGLTANIQQIDKSYSAAGGGNFSIDLSPMSNGGLYSKAVLEIKTLRNYYSLKIAKYRLYRIGSTAYALELLNTCTDDFKPVISNTGTTLNISFSGSYEESASSKQVSYIVYEE